MGKYRYLRKILTKSHIDNIVKFLDKYKVTKEGRVLDLSYNYVISEDMDKYAKSKGILYTGFGNPEYLYEGFVYGKEDPPKWFTGLKPFYVGDKVEWPCLPWGERSAKEGDLILAVDSFAWVVEKESIDELYELVQ